MPRPRKPDPIVAGVAAWFRGQARPLAWRTTPRDPYRSLVSEFMLQQTQVSRVEPKFADFLARFPAVTDLAAAPEAEVLAAWSGLGYYRRARLLHAAAKAIVERFDGRVPERVEDLESLPGVGRYTAGAIASIVYGHSAPIVDGNVSRVLLRVGAKRASAERASAWSWTRASVLAEEAHASGVVAEFNEGLMELGATVCLPRAPRCDGCPIAKVCDARRRGLQEKIPAPKRRSARATVHFDAILATDRRGRVLLERRGKGLWSGMWQPPTLESDDAPASAAHVRAAVGARSARLIEEFTHLTSHRQVEFRVWRAAGARPTQEGRAWVEPDRLDALALANAQRRILALLTRT